MSYVLRLAVSIELSCRAELYSTDHVFLNQKLDGKQSSTDVEKLFKIAFPHKVTDKVPSKNFDKIELIKAESKANLQNHRFSCLMDILALSSVIKKSIKLVYPLEEMNAYKHMNSGKVDHIDIDRQQGDLITIMWSSIPTLQTQAGKSKFNPNHFVPVVAVGYIETTVNTSKKNKSSNVSIKRKSNHNPQLPPPKIPKKDETLKSKIKNWLKIKIG